ncbi:MAG: HNH endonuclease [Allosphingosinicella sp.]
MAKIDPIAAHPLAGIPYEKLKFVRMNNRRVPLYSVEGIVRAPERPIDALGRAFAKYGGECFYCGKPFKPQPLSPKGPHRDHVMPVCDGGSDRLHNLVIACAGCGSAKSNKAWPDFDPKATKRYLAALEKHLARSFGWPASPSARPPPSPASAAGP